MKTSLFFGSLSTIREKPSRHLFLLSFLILFFELIRIRWMSSYELYLGLFYLAAFYFFGHWRRERLS